MKVDSEEHLRKACGRLRWTQLRRWLEKRAGGVEMLTLRCVLSSPGYGRSVAYNGVRVAMLAMLAKRTRVFCC